MEVFFMRKSLIKSVIFTLFFLSIFYCPVANSTDIPVEEHFYTNDSLIVESNISVEKFAIPRFEITLEKINEIQNNGIFNNTEEADLNSINNQKEITDKGTHTIKEESTKKENTSNPKDNDFEQTSKNYIGRFKIPEVGVNVACYAGNAQYIVDNKDSAAFFTAWSHQIIADHNNQGFEKVKKCEVGTIATFSVDGEILNYKCVAKMLGHNTGKILTDENYISISGIYPDTLVCYTCNENWQNITMVFFELIQDFDTKTEVDLEELIETKTENSTDNYNCKNGHNWEEWQIAWEAVSETGKQYGWERRLCKNCVDEEWKQIVY